LSFCFVNRPFVIDMGGDIFRMAGVRELPIILEAAQQGNPGGAEELLLAVYEELRSLAARKLAQSNPNQTLQPTALVHEAWLKLAGSRELWNGRSHFFRAAGEAMRQILIDQARRKSSQKRGSNPAVEEFHDSRIELVAPSSEALAVHDALDALYAEDALAAEVVKLRYFVGLSISEIADALGISVRTVDRHWAFARVWLEGAIRGNLSQ
jgi:RNA polymerase sigma factor (TIGR02999 family)